MTPKQFVRKWSAIQLKEATSSHSHFSDVCALVEHPDPLTFDPDGEVFTFEKRTDENGVKRGSADVWYRGKFIWEYKSPGKDLDKAYQQLLRYRESLDNPPLLITSDTNTIIIHTNFTGTVKEIHEISFERILYQDGLDLLKRAFFNPESFKPTLTKTAVTEATAATFLKVADALKQYDPSADPEKIAHFLVQLLFTIFAEDMGLLPNKIFTQLVERDHPPHRFKRILQSLFKVMKKGGDFGLEIIPQFNGDLFDYDYIPNVPSDLADPLLNAASQNWANINPTIFGTLFERIIDDEKRDQLIVDENRERVGVHYTSVEDIMLIVEPVLMQPLRKRWEETRTAARPLIREGDLTAAHALVSECAQAIANTTVLDPACGSGNFLYVALQELMKLQTALISYAERNGLEPIPLTVSPHQLYGIEINPYAHELAQITIWIGYIQWRAENGSPDIEEPILRPLNQVQRKDAILAYDDTGNPIEPEWPTVDVIIGNPPFLGNRKMRIELGDEVVDAVNTLYGVAFDHKTPDLVAYWFEKSRRELLKCERLRVGLIATNSIRSGTNELVLQKILDTGQIFMAWSDNPWRQESASVRVSIVGFDHGRERSKTVDGRAVDQINSDLSTGVDTRLAKTLDSTDALAFQGVVKRGLFDISKSEAQNMLSAINDSGVSNHDVVKPIYNAIDLSRRPREIWIVDFDNMSMEQAQQYHLPFQWVVQNVKPFRQTTKQKASREFWWRHWNTRPEMRAALAQLDRYLATPIVSKHRIFVWLDKKILPDKRLVVFANDSDYFLGVLHCRIHECWTLATCSWHGQGNDPRYTHTTTFETFPFPWRPGSEPSEDESQEVRAIGEAARALVAFRQKWLHPSIDQDDDQSDQISETQLKRRTLTNLYNALTLYRKNRRIGADQFKADTRADLSLGDIEELDDIHQELDRAVLTAYGWPHTLTDEQILEKLLALNLERAN